MIDLPAFTVSPPLAQILASTRRYATSCDKPTTCTRPFKIRQAHVSSVRMTTPTGETVFKGPGASPEVKDIYTPFWQYADGVLKSRLKDLDGYPIPDGFVWKEETVGKGKRAANVSTQSYAYKTSNLRQIRAANVQGGAQLQVLNFVMFPSVHYDLPFFGADFVTLPGGHLIAMDMQPFIHTDEYIESYSKPLQSSFEKHRQNLPWGGDFPDEATRFMSPSFVWSRPSEDSVVETHAFEAFKDYLNHYIDFVNAAEPVEDPAKLVEIKETQLGFLRSRAKKDPARGMFQRFYGKEWAEEYMNGFCSTSRGRLKPASACLPFEIHLPPTY